MSWKAMQQQSIDDSSVQDDRSSIFEDELKQKSMTLGRRQNRKIKPVEDNPPPPPQRSHSRKPSRTKTHVNDCTTSPSVPTRTRLTRNPDNPHKPPAPTPNGPQNERSLVASIANRLEPEKEQRRIKSPIKIPKSKVEVETETRPKPAVKRRPPQRESTEPALVPSGGIAAARAMLQARFAGEQSRTPDRDEDTQTAPEPKERSRTPSNARQNIPRSFPQAEKYTEGDRQPPPTKPANRSPAVSIKSSSPRPFSIQDSESNEQSSSGSGVFLIKESSSTESLDSPQVPPLPPKAPNEPQPIRNKPDARSKSMKPALCKPLVEKKERRYSEEQDKVSIEEKTPRERVASISEKGSNSQDTLQPTEQQLSGRMNLVTMISKGAHFFPTRVKVTKGFCSSICDSFSKFDRVYLHFVKNCKVGVLKDEYSYERYTVPISSSMEFGILYEAEGVDLSQFIPKVEDLMELNPLPAVVLATKEYNGGSPEKSVVANELLFLKQITKTGLGKSRALEVCTIDNQVKRLSSKCEGDFSLHPVHIKMTLSIVIQQSISLPQRIYLMPNPGLEQYLAETMTQNPVILEAIRGETSIVCSIVEDDSEEHPIMDVSKELGIEVELEGMTQREAMELHDTTSQLHQNFSPRTLRYIIEKQTKREYDLQCLLNQELIEGKEMDGVHLQLPSTFAFTPKEPPPSMVRTESAEAISVASSDEVESITSTDTRNDYEDVGTALAELPAEDINRLAKVIKKKESSTTSKFFKKLKTATKRKKQTITPYEETDFATPSIPLATKDVHNTVLPIETPESYEPVAGDDGTPDGEYSSVRNMDAHLLGLKTTTKESSPSVETESNYVQMNSKIANIMSELNALKQQLHQLSVTVESLVSKGTDPLPRIEQSPPAMIQTTTATAGQQNNGESEEMTRNRAFLRSLTHAQVGGI